VIGAVLATLAATYMHDTSRYVDAPPIQPGESAVYVYDLEEHNAGTHWLHSHYGFHHELGLAIPLVVDGPMPARCIIPSYVSAFAL
jgi:FtsP/CotA-like multicopper oxidase with cupredoxin domain